MHLDKILTFAKSLALQSGDILLNGFRSAETVVSQKSPTNLVTSIDFQSEQFIFTEIKKAFPDHGIIAEEGAQAEAVSPYVWYVDPLDGTNNFAHGIPVFCVSLGLYDIEKRKVIVGVVYDPVHKELFYAAQGCGSFLNADKLRVSETPAIEYAILATGFPYDKKGDDNNLKEFSRILPRIRGVRRMGSAALDLCFVASGRFDGYWEGGINPWDIAAGIIIVEESHGVVTNYHGDEFNIEGSHIIATNGRIHSGIVDLLR